MTDDDEQPTLPLIFTYVYDDVDINSPVPWDELSSETQHLAKRVVDHYRMRASVKVDAQITVKSLNIEADDEDVGLLFSLIATVEPLGDNNIDYEELFSVADDDDNNE